LRIIAYKEVLKYKANKTYNDFYLDMFSKATMLNDYSNHNNPLTYSEIKQINNSICKWTWRNFTAERFSSIQSARAKKTRKAKSLINFLEDL
ncbi:replication protein, partial [Salmonella enterica]|nr:replication protein [Salmonella enterica subsp. enterica serovar Derby]